MLFKFSNWYTAGGAGQVSKGSVSGTQATITAGSDVTLTDNANYFITFEVEQVNNTALYLSEAKTSGNNTSLVTYLVDGRGYAVETSATNFALGERVLSKLFKVTATVCTRSGEANNYVYTPVSNLSAAELAELHAINQDISIDITAHAEDQAISPVEHACHLAAAESNTTEGSYIADATNNTITVTVNPSTFASGNWNGSAQIAGYFLLRIDGGDGSTTVGGVEQVTTGTVTCTISVDAE